MSPHCRWFACFVTILSASFGLLSPVHAKLSAWKDGRGGSFRGEPTEILGPLVIFSTSGDGGRRIPLRAFSQEDCLRIHTEIAARPGRADHLAEAKGYATGELVGNVLRIQGRELVTADLTGQPEPELLLVLCGSHNDGDGWFMSGSLKLFYGRVQRVYPGLMEGVFLGARHDRGQHRDIAINSGMPWLVADLGRQNALRAMVRFVPAEGATVALVTRQGVPLVAARVSDIQSVRGFVDQVSELLWQIDPANPAGWADRLHYLNATRPTEFARSRTPPVLVGNPLRPDALRKYGVRRVAARLAVAADGKVAPELLSGPADVPAELVAPLTSVLGQAVAVPALDEGRPVAGSLDYLLEVRPAEAWQEAERFWLSTTSYPVVPITDWLVLRPIKVSEKDFESAVVGEKADGTVILNAFEVNSGKISRAAQMSAFNSDWFTTAGADSVRPKAGDRQIIDDNTILTWENVRSKDGYVDMQTGIPKDYTVGYAWTEFTVSRETDAWLGLGSDDGVKIWLNGALVYDKWIRRPSQLDDDVVPLHLKPGANRILIKIQNATGDWSFMYRLRTKP
jgi:hypothetical protein